MELSEYNNFITMLNRYKEVLDSGNNISFDDMENLLKLYTLIGKTNLSKNERKNIKDRIFLLIRDSLSFLISRLNISNVEEEIGKVIKEYESIIKFFDKNEGFRNFNKLDINHDISTLFNLRRIINSYSGYDILKKKKITIFIDILLNLLMLNKDVDSYLSYQMDYSILQVFVDISSSNEHNFLKLKRWFLVNESHFTKKNYKKIYCLFKSKFVNDIYMRVRNNESLLDIYDQIFFLNLSLNNLSIESMRKIKKIVLILEHDNNMNEAKEKLLENLQLSVLEMGKIEGLDAIVNEKKIFNREYPRVLSKNINIHFHKSLRESEKQIITVDEAFSPDLDSAFSISDLGNVYDYDIYITDVPSFLLANRDIAKIAYHNATSYYLHNNNGDGNYNIDMLPQFLSHKLLSLNDFYPQNVIDFHFIISKKGEIISSDISLKTIRVNANLSKMEAQYIIDNENTNFHQELMMLKDMCIAIGNTSSLTFLKRLYNGNMFDLVALSSVIINYFVGKESSFAIYRNNSQYTKEKKEYTHSATPLRRIVSDINLGFYLNQLGLVHINDQDIYLVMDNLDEIIRHLNEREGVEKYVRTHERKIRKVLNLK